MWPLDPQRVAELQRRLAARSLREEDFQILPDLLAWFRQLGQLLSSEEDLTEERLQASLLGSAPEVEEAAPTKSTNRRAPRPGRSGRSGAEKRSRKRRR
jgi:hypothetical protein